MDTPIFVLAFMGLSPTELLIVGVVAVLLFGSRLPSVARSAGKSLTEFRRGMQDLQNDVRRSIDAEEAYNSTKEKPGSTVGREIEDQYTGANYSEESAEEEEPAAEVDPGDPAPPRHEPESAG